MINSDDSTAHALVNLGFPLPEPMRELLRQQEDMRRQLSGPLRAFEQMTRSTRTAVEALEQSLQPSTAFAEAMASVASSTIPSLQLDTVKALQDSVAGLSGRFEAAARPLKGLFGGEVEAARLAETMRFAKAFADLPTAGLLQNVSERLDELAESREPELLDVAGLIAITTEESAKLRSGISSRADVIAVLGIVISILFGLPSVVGDQRSGERLEGLESAVARQSKDHAASVDSLRAVLEEFIATSLSAIPMTGQVTPTHTVSRRLHLRAGPDSDAISIQYVEAGQGVAVIQRVNGWAHSVVLDPANDRLVVGWLYDRCLHEDQRDEW